MELLKLFKKVFLVVFIQKNMNPWKTVSAKVKQSLKAARNLEVFTKEPLQVFNDAAFFALLNYHFFQIYDILLFCHTTINEVSRFYCDKTGRTKIQKTFEKCVNINVNSKNSRNNFILVLFIFIPPPFLNHSSGLGRK